MARILIIEDNKNTRKLMTAILIDAGYEVSTACDGVEALHLLSHTCVDLAVVDIMMPNMDGYEFTRRLRNENNTLPILMVSAKQFPADRKKGFLLGIDDFMTKPVDEEEMLLRIKAILRRTKISTEQKIVIGEVTLDYNSLSVIRKGESQTLPQKEFYLLYKLLSHPNVIFTRVQLMDEIWGMDSESTDATINTHINRLRKRFEDYPEFEIVTIRGLGYKAVKCL